MNRPTWQNKPYVIEQKRKQNEKFKKTNEIEAFAEAWNANVRLRRCGSQDCAGESAAAPSGKGYRGNPRHGPADVSLMRLPTWGWHCGTGRWGNTVLKAALDFGDTVSSVLFIVEDRDDVIALTFERPVRLMR